MIQLFYGFGKGKTTSAIGAGMRAKGAGLSVLFVQFFKDNTSSELAVLPFDVFPSPNQLPFNPSVESYKPWVDSALNYIKSSTCDVVILDEFVDLIPKFLSDEQAVDLLCDDKKEYILTGHYSNNLLLEKADYVTFFENKKHPYEKGVNARKGFEF
jgi:cob(I)alamin adenosyltransferase